MGIYQRHGAALQDSKARQMQGLEGRLQGARDAIRMVRGAAMKQKLKDQFDQVQRSYRHAKPRSTRSTVLYRDLVKLKQQIMQRELKGKSK
jgi:hypothetical protein